MLGLSEEAMRPFEFQKIPFSKHTLLAFSGWYDYSFVPTISPQKHLQTKNLFWFDRRFLNEWDLIQPLPNVCCESWNKNSCKWILLDHRYALCSLIVSFSCVTPYFERFNAFLGGQAFHELF